MMWQVVGDIVLFLLTEVLLVVVATYLLVKALMFNRDTPLGRAMAQNNFAMSLVYYSAFFAAWWAVARHPVVSISLRVYVAVTTALAVREFVRVYGGWRAAGRELRRSAGEWVCAFQRGALRMCSFVEQGIKKIWLHCWENRKLLALLVVLVMMVVLLMMVRI